MQEQLQQTILNLLNLTNAFIARQDLDVKIQVDAISGLATATKTLFDAFSANPEIELAFREQELMLKQREAEMRLQMEHEKHVQKMQLDAQSHQQNLQMKQEAHLLANAQKYQNKENTVD